MAAELVAGRFLLIDGVAARSGGQSVIRKAVDSRTGAPVALKIISVGSDSVARKIHQREVDALRKIDHPHIVKMIDWGTDETGSRYVALEWIESTLATRVEVGDIMAWAPAVSDVLLPLTEATAFLHLQGLEHRDIKPANILVDDGGRVVLADFGIGKSREVGPETGMTVQGFRSGIYAPPELEDVVHYVRDVYSIGVLGIQLMHGQRLLNPQDLEPALDNIDAPASLRQLLSECINSDPELRPKNASVLLERLRLVQHEARVGGLVESNLAELVLSARAREQLAGGGRLDRASDIASKDLNGVTYVSYLWNSAESARDANVIFFDR